MLDMLLDRCLAVLEGESLTAQFWWLGFRGAQKLRSPLDF
jgi:hypothetical protein